MNLVGQIYIDDVIDQLPVSSEKTQYILRMTE